MDWAERSQDVTRRRLMITRMRKKVRAVLAQYRSARKKMSVDTRVLLRKRRVEIAVVVAQLRCQQRMALHQSARTALPPADIDRVTPEPIHAWPRDIADKPVRDDAYGLEQSVLRVLQARPDGMTMSEIGNEIGVDWRILVSQVQLLADAGSIERVEELIYPVWK